MLPGVLLLQLGTPDAPTTPALRRYLAEFLSDPRVVDLPRALWRPLLHLVVLRTRPRKSAHAYQQIWTPAGSPLAVTTTAQASGLAARLAARSGQRIPVAVAMRYGNPSIESALETLTRQGVTRILAFPMYPQYAGATTGSSLERLFGCVARMREVPSIRVVPPYFGDPAYIGALAAATRASLATLADPPETLVFSFHGLPKRYADEGDPYPAQCHATAARLVEALGRPPASCLTAFQSRFGREEWLQPYLDRTLVDLGRAGTRVAVMCPGFTADCLETLEEIGLRGAASFREAGGRAFHLVPCLNDDPAWLDGMATIAQRELSGWL